jgi:hypothetical protein
MGKPEETPQDKFLGAFEKLLDAANDATDALRAFETARREMQRYAKEDRPTTNGREGTADD